MQFVFFLWMWNKNMQLPIHSLFLVRCAMSCNGGCSTIWTVIPNKGHDQLSPELSMAHWLGVDFVPLFHIEDVCVCYWNLCGPEEQLNHHLSDLQMKQYIAVYWSAVSTLYSAHVHLVYNYALLPPSASPDRLWHVYAPSAEHIHHHTFVMPCQQWNGFIIPLWYITFS